MKMWQLFLIGLGLIIGSIILTVFLFCMAIEKTSETLDDCGGAAECLGKAAHDFEKARKGDNGETPTQEEKATD